MRLAQRIRTQPATSSAATSGGDASPGGAPQVMPLAQVLVVPQNSQYVTLGYRMMSPMFTTDGAVLPATAPGRFGQLVAAGKP